MANTKTFNGAKNAMMLYYSFFNEVVKEIGLERTLAIVNKSDGAMGVIAGRAIKTQAGTGEFDGKAVASIARDSIKEGYGISSKMIADSPQKIVFRIGKCPVYEAAREVGLDAKIIEDQCRAGSLNFMDKMVKQLNPDLNYQLMKFRSASNDFCEESIVTV